MPGNAGISASIIIKLLKKSLTVVKNLVFAECNVKSMSRSSIYIIINFELGRLHSDYNEIKEATFAACFTQSVLSDHYNFI